MTSSSSEQQQEEADQLQQQIQLLTSTDDDYGGVIVEMDQPTMDSTTFLSILRPSISNWKHQVVITS
jgi:hypothetical protein